MDEHDNAFVREEEHEYTQKSRKEKGLTGYELFKFWYSFVSELPVEVRPVHHAIMAWVFELYNMSGKADAFQLATKEAIAILGINHPDTYQKAIKQLVAWGCLRIVKEARGTYVARWVSLKECPVFDHRIDNIVQPIIQPTSQPKKQVKQQVKQRVKQQVKRAPIIKGINKEIGKSSNIKDISDDVSVDPNKCNVQEALFEHTPNEDKKAVAKPKEYSSVYHIQQKYFQLRPDDRDEWSGKHAKLAKSLSEKIEKRFEGKNGRKPSSEEIGDAFQWIVENLPEWRKKDGWTLGGVVSGFGDILFGIEQAHKNRKKTTDEVLAEALELARNHKEPDIMDILNGTE